MKKTIRTVLLTSVLGAGSLWAQSSMDETQMRAPAKGGAQMAKMGMDPKMKEEMQKNMQDKILMILRSELGDTVTAKTEKAIRAKLKTAMDEMSKKMEKEMQGKIGKGMMPQGMGTGRQGGMMPGRVQKGDMGRIKMH